MGVKLEAVGWVMVRFLRRHSLDKSSSRNHLQQQQQQNREADNSDAEMTDGSTPPLPNGRAAPRGRRDGPPSGTH